MPGNVGEVFTCSSFVMRGSGRAGKGLLPSGVGGLALPSSWGELISPEPLGFRESFTACVDSRE